jgi:hypothetical protein
MGLLVLPIKNRWAGTGARLPPAAVKFAWLIYEVTPTKLLCKYKKLAKFVDA